MFVVLTGVVGIYVWLVSCFCLLDWPCVLLIYFVIVAWCGCAFVFGVMDLVLLVRSCVFVGGVGCCSLWRVGLGCVSALCCWWLMCSVLVSCC